MHKFILLLLFSIMICPIKSKAEQLNNLVDELYSQQNISFNGNLQLNIHSSKAGWVYLKLEAKDELPDQTVLHIDREKSFNLKPDAKEQKKSETMFFLAPGGHELEIEGKSGVEFKEIILRQVPEMLYCSLGYDPAVAAGKSFGPYDLKFLKESGFLNTTNVMIIFRKKSDMEQCASSEDQKTFLTDWQKSGKRLFNMSDVSESMGAKNYSNWASAISPAWVDGIIVDEFGTSHDLDSYVPLLKKLHANFPGKDFYPWIGHGYVDDDLTFDPRKEKAGKFEKFINTLIACDYKFVPERYFSDFWPTRQEAFQSIKRTLIRDMKLWQKAFPGCEKNMIICVNSFVLENCSRNVNPANDYKIVMDYVMNCLANVPEFKGLYGIMAWGARGADPETMRWQAALQRHYCLEGRKDMLSEKYGFQYKTDFLENPDFEDGIKGWNINPAEKNSIKNLMINDLGVSQGRKPASVLRGKSGNHALCMIRSSQMSNQINQNIKNLIPGKTYSLKILAVNPDDLRKKQLSKLDIKIKNADLVNESCRCFLYTGKRQKKDYHYCTYYYFVFKAKAPNAELVISDFPDKGEPRPVPDKIAINFVEAQPYFE